ncbi:MAG TPA: DnaJ C-terminal domain-containing protein [Paucimonas sp.]|nr:DnaJ C-terminal domain-containing protein [Paucimonas sp.]
MEFKDYYQALGVARDAGADDIKKAFRKLARKYHPDVSKEPDAEARMKELNEAFAVLSDPEKRAAYDRLGQRFHAGQDFHPPPDWDAGFEFSGRGFSGAEAADFSDFFSELFGGRFGGAEARGGRHAGPGWDDIRDDMRDGFRARGEDHHAKLMLDLEDAYRGAVRTVTLRVPRLDAAGRPVLQEHTLDVRIPQGVYEGQMIRLAGQGGPGMGTDEAGDLYLEVHFKPHGRYRVEGRDVYASLPVTPWEAALGASVLAPVPDGAVEVRIPAGSQSGRKLRLKGRGIPGRTPGDLYLVLEVVLPPADTPRARELYETMAREMNFDPRRGG